MGIISDKEILTLMDSGDILIYPFEKRNLTPVGYNLTATDFILSINDKLLVDIQSSGDEKFCFVEPNDTVLIMTREAVLVSNKIAGTFHSRVSVVSRGFGHISTTLDPSWQGPLLISLNNPTNKKVKLILGKFINYENEADKVFVNNAFTTLVFQKLNDEPIEKHNNPPGRFDILKTIVDEPSKMKWWKPWKNYRSHRDQLKTFIGEIGLLTFMKVQEGYNKDEFIRNSEDFFQTFSFYTDQARQATRKILDRKILWKRAKLAFSLLFILGFFITAWKLSGGAQTPSRVAFFALMVAAIAAAPAAINIYNAIKRKGD